MIATALNAFYGSVCVPAASESSFMVGSHPDNAGTWYTNVGCVR